MHKETKRIVAAIRKGGMPIYSATVNVGSWKNFFQIAKEVAAECPDTATVLGCIIEKPQRSLYVAVICPAESKASVQDWLNASLACNAETEVESREVENYQADNFTISGVGLTYEAASEQSPFKLVDQVIGCSTAYLKRVGVYEEEEDEYEYGFDDI